jgi:hypothetical protein
LPTRCALPPTGTAATPDDAEHVPPCDVAAHSQPSEYVASTSTYPATHVLTWHAPPVHVVEDTSDVSGQSAVVQQAAFGMHELLAGQIFCPLGHAHAPGGPPTHVSPTTVHSAFEQHSEFGMHELVVWHVCVPAGHVQLPPMPEQCSPTIGQSLSMQHVPVGMHVWKVLHTR